MHIPYTKKQFIDFAKHLRPDLKNQSLKSWFADFMRRWSTKLGVHAAKGLTKAHVRPETLEDCHAWVNELPAFLDRHGLSLKNMVNADETRLRISLGSNSEVTINTTRRPKRSREEAKGTKYGTYLPFVLATGELVMDVFVIPVTIAPSV
jgi:hypothetical protein